MTIIILLLLTGAGRLRVRLAWRRSSLAFSFRCKRQAQIQTETLSRDWWFDNVHIRDIRKKRKAWAAASTYVFCPLLASSDLLPDCESTSLFDVRYLCGVVLFTALADYESFVVTKNFSIFRPHESAKNEGCPPTRNKKFYLQHSLHFPEFYNRG